jgi:2-polyprenyl-3-methyl-5-hydroxy-6-metoxy-1,4-benzoquinol methylase
MKIIHAINRRLLNNIRLFFRSFFYRFIFGQRVPFGAEIEKIITSWECKHSTGDNPVPREIWESQYLSNKWKYMEQLDELARYSIIVGYMAYIKPQGAILDVGCGEGILFERYRPYGYSKYLGIDISEIAINRLSKHQDKNTVFIRTDAEAFRPAELYDVIVFNESLYYFHEPLIAFERYSHALKQGGILIISTYTTSHRAMAILSKIKAKCMVFDETQTTQQSRSWLCTVLALQKESK